MLSEYYLKFQLHGVGPWTNWFDKDLGVAGKVRYYNDDMEMTTMLWDSKKALINVASDSIVDAAKLK